jgi:hypothetical protein
MRTLSKACEKLRGKRVFGGYFSKKKKRRKIEKKVLKSLKGLRFNNNYTSDLARTRKTSKKKRKKKRKRIKKN